MSVTEDDVRKTARLARIALPDSEVETMTQKLNGILGWVEQLQEVDVEGVEPMTSVTPMALKMREDVVTDGDQPERALSNAPADAEGFFVVPKVVE